MRSWSHDWRISSRKVLVTLQQVSSPGIVIVSLLKYWNCLPSYNSDNSITTAEKSGSEGAKPVAIACSRAFFRLWPTPFFNVWVETCFKRRKAFSPSSIDWHTKKYAGRSSLLSSFPRSQLQPNSPLRVRGIEKSVFLPTHCR